MARTVREDVEGVRGRVRARGVPTSGRSNEAPRPHFPARARATMSEEEYSEDEDYVSSDGEGARGRDRGSTRRATRFRVTPAL